MKAAVFAYSRLGCKTAERAAGYFSGYQLRMFAPQRVNPGHFRCFRPMTRIFMVSSLPGRMFCSL